MKFGPAQRLKDSDFLDMERQLTALFYDILFEPVIKIISATNKSFDEASVLRNAEDAKVLLWEALKKGKVQYVEGLFTGTFDARISKALRSIGATWNKQRGAFVLDPAKTAGWIKEQSANYNARVKAAHDSIIETLGKIAVNAPGYIDAHGVSAGKTVGHVERGFNQHVESYGIDVPVSEHVKEQLSVEYNHNMKLYIKKWSEEAITDLRSKVDENAGQGYRFDKLVDVIKHRYGVAQSKAKFLARQETGLLMSKYRKHRFTEAGITHYKWRGSKDERERPDHRRLEGKIFAYADPPVTNTKTGARNNPGEDFQCRCNDEPVLTPIGLGVIG